MDSSADKPLPQAKKRGQNRPADGASESQRGEKRQRSENDQAPAAAAAAPDAKAAEGKEAKQEDGPMQQEGEQYDQPRSMAFIPLEKLEKIGRIASRVSPAVMDKFRALFMIITR